MDYTENYMENLWSDNFRINKQKQFNDLKKRISRAVYSEKLAPYSEELRKLHEESRLEAGFYLARLFYEKDSTLPMLTTPSDLASSDEKINEYIDKMVATAKSKSKTRFQEPALRENLFALMKSGVLPKNDHFFSKTDLLEIALRLALSLEETQNFLQRSIADDGMLFFDKAEDLIRMFVISTPGVKGADEKSLYERYLKETSGVTKKEFSDRPEDITRETADNFVKFFNDCRTFSIEKHATNISLDELKQQFIDQLKAAAPYLDVPTRSGRNVYYCLVKAYLDLSQSGGGDFTNPFAMIKAFQCDEFSFDLTSSDLRSFMSDQWGDDFRYPSYTSSIIKTFSVLERLSAILDHGDAPQKEDILVLFFLFCCKFWRSNDSKVTTSKMLSQFDYGGDRLLQAARLPRIYEPAMLETSMLMAILSSTQYDVFDAFKRAYESLYDEFSKSSGTKKTELEKYTVALINQYPTNAYVQETLRLAEKVYKIRQKEPTPQLEIEGHILKVGTEKISIPERVLYDQMEYLISYGKKKKYLIEILDGIKVTFTLEEIKQKFFIATIEKFCDLIDTFPNSVKKYAEGLPAECNLVKEGKKLADKLTQAWTGDCALVLKLSDGKLNNIPLPKPIINALRNHEINTPSKVKPYDWDKFKEQFSAIVYAAKDTHTGAEQTLILQLIACHMCSKELGGRKKGTDLQVVIEKDHAAFYVNREKTPYDKLIKVAGDHGFELMRDSMGQYINSVNKPDPSQDTDLLLKKEIASVAQALVDRLIPEKDKNDDPVLKKGVTITFAERIYFTTADKVEVEVLTTLSKKIKEILFDGMLLPSSIASEECEIINQILKTNPYLNYTEIQRYHQKTVLSWIAGAMKPLLLKEIQFETHAKKNRTLKLQYTEKRPQKEADKYASGRGSKWVVPDLFDI